MATTMLNVYDLARRKTAVLQNAFNITETKELNQIYTLDFSMPATDEKAQYIQPFHYVRFGEDGELYRIINVRKSEGNTDTLAVTCEHVIATLVDDLLFGVFQYGGGTIRTADVIKALLKKQNTANWTLGECDFSRRFEYLWEQENILNALYSIPKEFTKAYKWTFDTTVYPWVLSLKAIDETIHPEYYIRAKSNLLGSEAQQDFSGVCTRIYPLGYGEGINQLGIKEINGNKPYLEASADVIARYGVKEKVLVDRRYENAESLKAYGQTMLDALSVPGLSRSFSVVDLYPITGAEIDNAQPGQIAKLTEDGTITYITKTTRILDQPGTLQIDLSTKATDIASSIADLADRVRIESVYAQGATQLYQHSKDANATPTKGMVMSLYFPSEMRQINKVLLRLKLGKFRSYSQATSTEDVTVKSCENKEVTVKTVENKEVTVRTNPTALDNLMTTQDGGGTTSSSGGSRVTVGGGYVSGESTDNKTVSMNVSVSGTVSAPMETQTSLPSTEVTSGTDWLTGDNYVTAGYTEDAYLDVGNGNAKIEITGGGGSTQTVDQDYSMTGGPLPWGVADDSHYHQLSHHHTVNLAHSHGINQSGHDHRLYDIEGNEAAYHRHAIKKSELSHSHNITHYHTVSVRGSASGGNHSHTFNIPNHTHTITSHSHNLPSLSHSHDIKLNSHTHTVKLNPHTHDIKLEGHSHTITAGIFESGNPTKFDIYVGGELRTSVNATSYDGDIATWLLTADKQIPRGQWIDIEIRPNDLAYVQSSVFVQGFVQSRGGGNY